MISLDFIDLGCSHPTFGAALGLPTTSRRALERSPAFYASELFEAPARVSRGGQDRSPLPIKRGGVTQPTTQFLFGALQDVLDLIPNQVRFEERIQWRKCLDVGSKGRHDAPFPN